MTRTAHSIHSPQTHSRKTKNSDKSEYFITVILNNVDPLDLYGDTFSSYFCYLLEYLFQVTTILWFTNSIDIQED